MNKVEKMEQALEEVIEKIEKWRTDGDMEHWQYSQLFDIVDNALAIPKRNCDVGTPEEQYRRFRAFCESSDSGGDFDNPCRGCELNHPFGCETVFANLPYKGEEGED